MFLYVSLHLIGLSGFVLLKFYALMCFLVLPEFFSTEHQKLLYDSRYQVTKSVKFLSSCISAWAQILFLDRLKDMGFCSMTDYLCANTSQQGKEKKKEQKPFPT